MQGVLHCQNVAKMGGVNIYAQLQEPSKKDGIWIKTKKTLTNDNKYIQLEDMPAEFQYGSATAIGDDIYLVKNNLFYKYNILTSEYTQLLDVPFNGAGIIAVDKDIYLFYGYIAYKYNTITGKHTQLSNIPFSFTGKAIAAVGTDIYLFGGSGSSSYKKYAYKYNTITDEYTKLADIPYLFENGLAVSIGDDIYLFGAKGTTYHIEAYKYSTKSNTYTKLADIPYEFFDGSIVAIDDNIYLFGNASSNSATAKLRKYAYKYSTKSNTYTRLTDLPYDFSTGLIEKVGDDIYLFGGGTSATTAYKCVFDILPEIQKYKFNKVKLVSSLIDEKNTLINKNVYIQMTQIKAKIYDDNELKDYPCYWRRWRKVELNSVKLYFRIQNFLFLERSKP